MKNVTELTDKELRTINGGGLFGNNDSMSEGGLTGMLGIDNLLSFSSESRDGDEQQRSSFSLGNGINLDFLGIGSSSND